jgi:hypothetical protein
MKKHLILIWLLCPIAFLYFHFTLGVRCNFENEVNQKLQACEEYETQNRWDEAIKKYDDVLLLISNFIQDEKKKSEEKKKTVFTENEKEISRAKRLEIQVMLARAKALTNAKQISESANILGDILSYFNSKGVDDSLTDEVRNNLAICQYYIAWHMRLEGMLRSDWFPELESSRQIFKYLAEKKRDSEDSELSLDFQKNLEAVIRMERMDLPTLRKMKLPKKGAGKGEQGAGQKSKKTKKDKN